MDRMRGWYVGGAVVAMVAGLALGRVPERSPQRPAGGGKPAAVAAGPEKERQGVKFRLTEGAAEEPAKVTPPAAPASPLSEDETRRLLSRLPELGPQPG